MEQVHFFLLPVVDALEMMSGTDRPVNRAGANPQHLFNFIKKFIGVSCLPVKLIDKGENGNVPHHTNFKELNGLRLHTFCAINHHDRTVRRHQGSVGVLGEILMSRCVQNIDTLSVIVELQYRRSDGNSSFLLNLHPIGNSVLGRLSSFYRSCQINSPAIKQELLRQGRLSRIRVRNNRKGSPLFNFFF